MKKIIALIFILVVLAVGISTGIVKKTNISEFVHIMRNGKRCITLKENDFLFDVLQVIDTDGNVIDEWTSGKEAHKVNGLEENKTYKLHEEVSVGNFVKATDIEFKVTTDKETQKITVK